MNYSRLLIILGLILILISVLTFPTKTWVQVEEYERDLVGIGWFFAPIICMWGLASVVLGIVQLKVSSAKVIVVFIIGAASIFSGICASAAIWNRTQWFWWLYFFMNVIPSLMMYIVSYRYFKSGLTILSKKQNVAIISIIIIIPLVYSAWVLSHYF